jgi:hypothetical protein
MSTLQEWPQIIQIYPSELAAISKNKPSKTLVEFINNNTEVKQNKENNNNIIKINLQNNIDMANY